MDGRVEPEFLAALEWAFQEALEESVQGNSTALGVDGGPGQGTGTCHAS